MTIDQKFGQALIDRIKQEGIAPRPRWHFLAKDYAVWGLGLLALFIGGLSAAVFIYLLRPGEWGAYERWAENWLDSVFLAATSIWLVLLAGFLAVFNYNIKHTKKGYRYPLWQVLAASVAGSLAFGFIFYHAGIGEAIDDVLAVRLPWYEQIANRGMDRWSDPRSGRLNGMVITLDESGDFVIAGLDRQPWRVSASGAQIIPPAEVRVGVPLRLVGSSTGSGEFRAEAILPAGPGRRFVEHNMPPEHMAGMREMMRQMMDATASPPFLPGCGGRDGAVGGLLVRFPVLREVLTDGVSANRELIRTAIGEDAQLIEALKCMEIGPSVWE